MANKTDIIASHCLVQWDDNKKEYAVVDIKRCKTILTIKVGLSTICEGYRRQRRRGKVVFLGCKTDCFTFGYETVNNDGHAQLNTYRWSCPPGLHEKADEIRQAIQAAVKATGTIGK